MSVLVHSGTMHIGLLKILIEALKLRPENHTIGIKYVVALGTSPGYRLLLGAEKEQG